MGARILIIEDNPDNLDLMTLLLSCFGHTPIGAADGVLGIEIARRERPDLVLSDIHMPGKDGYAVARELTGDPTTASIPLVAVTALVMTGDREKGLAAGFRGYLFKPIDPATFVAQVEQFLPPELRGSEPVVYEEEPAASEPSREVKASVLVVDDSKINRELIQETLTPLGYDVRTAPSVQKGLQMARSSVPDLILSDLHMPGEDGFNFIRLVKADSELADVPFIFISSSVWGERDRETAFQLGVSRFLLRPIEPGQLVEEIERCIDAYKGLRARTLVLIVDDRAINREFLADLLADAEYDTVQAPDGAIALELVRARRPDLIITDILMPRMGGIEFADRVRADASTENTPIIFYTATYKLSEVRQLADSCRASAILAKPSEPQIILDAIRAALDDGACSAGVPHYESKVPANGSDIRAPQAVSSGIDARRSLIPKMQLASHALTLRLATLLELNMSVCGQSDVQSMLQMFCRGAQDIMNCRVVVACILDATGRRVERFGTFGLDDAVAAQFASIDPLTGIFSEVVSSRTVHRARNETGATTTLGMPGFHPPVESLLLVPIPTRSTTTVCGWIAFADKIGRGTFDGEDEEFAVTLAAQIALAYGNLAQYDEIQQYAAKLESEVAERRRAQDDLSRRMTHDQVTGLPRFVLVESGVQAALVEAARSSGRVIVLYVDIDHFHMINELRGRSFGDLVLCAVADRLKRIAGERGWVAHIAGDELLAAIVDVDGTVDPVEFANAARHTLEEPIEHDGERAYVTCSIGVSCFPDNGDSALELMRQAEAAMQRVKRTTGNSVGVFANEQKRELADRGALGLRLKQAIRNGELLAHYQPIVSGQDWHVLGFEALVRWQHPQRGLLLPGQFLQVAEELGLIVEIGNFMLDTACRQARSWIDERGAADFFIAVNVSVLQLHRPNFVDEVRSAIDRWKLSGTYIELELTENVLVGNVDRVRTMLQELKALGVKVALDDFGTSYSSLNYLRQLPIDKLKIDQSFVKDVISDVSSAGICRAIASLGHQLGMTVLAEGVETAAQVAYLLRNECDAFQGFYFSRAVAPDEAIDILLHRYVAHDTAIMARESQTLLLVDDEENVLSALHRLLRRDGYRILKATSAAQAFELLATNQVQVILSDQRMPEMSGTEFLGQVKQLYPDTVRMVLSGYTDLSAVTEGINRGAIYKFLTKPWSDDELRVQVRDAFRIANRHKEPKPAASASEIVSEK